MQSEAAMKRGLVPFAGPELGREDSFLNCRFHFAD
jgi:hypothetical protein